MNVLSPDPGEAADRIYDAQDGTAVARNPSQFIFPIVKVAESGAPKLIGTGFYIAENGVFATAKHVFLDVLDRDGNQKFPIAIVHFLPGNRQVLRPVLRCTWNTVADVAVGVAAPMQNDRTGERLKNRLLILSVLRPSLGDDVFTYAYPKSVIREQDREIDFLPRYYDGKIEEVFPDGRDKVMMPAPCYRTSMNVYSGASGGPVWASHGGVFGINSTGMDGSEPAVSFVSRVNELLPLALDGVEVPGSQGPSSVKIMELAENGFVVFKPPLRDVLKAWEERDRSKNPRSIPFRLISEDDNI